MKLWTSQYKEQETLQWKQCLQKKAGGLGQCGKVTAEHMVGPRLKSQHWFYIAFYSVELHKHVPAWLIFFKNIWKALWYFITQVFQTLANYFLLVKLLGKVSVHYGLSGFKIYFLSTDCLRNKITRLKFENILSFYAYYQMSLSVLSRKTLALKR